MSTPRPGFLVLFLLATTQWIGWPAFADVRLPRLVGDHMVLQRDAKVTVWGLADPREQIEIAFHGQKISTRSNPHGQWSISLGPFTAGGPYELVIAGKNRLVVHDILLGDVWLASGQSNMEFQLAAGGPDKMPGVINADQEAASANFPTIRLFHVHRQFAAAPHQDVEADGWTAVTSEAVSTFSAVAYFFGRELHERYHVPIGLIESSWGGTVAEAWASADALKSFPEFKETIDSLRVVDERRAIAELHRYQQEKSEWYRKHVEEDRGRVNGVDVWAASDFDASSWPTLIEPQIKPAEALKGFDGVVWFRRQIEVPTDAAGHDLTLHLQYAYKSDTTFFNGRKIGESPGIDPPQTKDYVVPGELVKSGRNVIAVRIKGSGGFVGMYSEEATNLATDVAGQVIPLAGPWSYQAGPDLTQLPTPSRYSKLNSEPNAATVLFNAMIAPLTPCRIRGVIWYQGEANAIEKRSAQYRTLFPALIVDWRKQWGYEFPFLFVQLAGWPPKTDGAEPPAQSTFAELREAQSMTLSLPNTGMATAVDQPDDHPRDKRTVGHRLALTAAKMVYGENIVESGPVFSSMQIEGSQIRLKFSSLGSGLQVKDKYGCARGFEVAGADGKFQWAQARQDGEDILVSSVKVRQPTAVRYDWTDTPDGNVFNKEGLPALPFRTTGPNQ